MKNRIIDELGIDRFVCSRCGQSVDEFDSICDTCGQHIATINEFPMFDNEEQGEDFYSNGKYKIMEIKGLTDDKFGECILVEANPIEKSKLNISTISFIPYVNDKTLRFIYPETQQNISFLTNIANSSLLEIDFADFQEQSVRINSKLTKIYRHNSFYKHNTYLSDRFFFNGIINPSLISKTQDEDKYKIILPNGDCYMGEIENNAISGWGTYYFANSRNIPVSELDMVAWQHYRGSFRNGFPNGIGVFVSEYRNNQEQGRKVEEWGYFLNGKKNGVCFCVHEKILEIGIYCNDNKIIDLTEDFISIVDITEMTPTFWYKKLGIWIGTMYSEKTNDYNGLLILANGNCYLGTLPGGFNRTKIKGMKILQNGEIENGEWVLDINGAKPTEWAFV